MASPGSSPRRQRRRTSIARADETPSACERTEGYTDHRASLYFAPDGVFSEGRKREKTFPPRAWSRLEFRDVLGRIDLLAGVRARGGRLFFLGVRGERGQRLARGERLSGSSGFRMGRP
ncbi:MAG: hypothetical protein ACRDHF_10670 [Tepidiformaceae bacterium]